MEPGLKSVKSRVAQKQTPSRPVIQTPLSGSHAVWEPDCICLPSAPPTVPAEKRESETSLRVGFCPFSEGHLSVKVLGRFSDGLII